jgi:hypothetical protein
MGPMGNGTTDGKTKGRPIQQLIADLNALTAADFDMSRADADGVRRCYDLADEILAWSSSDEVVNAVFAVFERLPDSDLGSPGPLIHTIEKVPGYESRLLESVERHPTPHTVWMINRLLNLPQPRERRKQLLNLLRNAASHPLANTATRERARRFLQWQHSSGRTRVGPRLKR